MSWPVRPPTAEPRVPALDAPPSAPAVSPLEGVPVAPPFPLAPPTDAPACPAEPPARLPAASESRPPVPPPLAPPAPVCPLLPLSPPPLILTLPPLPPFPTLVLPRWPTLAPSPQASTPITTKVSSPLRRKITITRCVLGIRDPAFARSSGSVSLAGSPPGSTAGCAALLGHEFVWDHVLGDGDFKNSTIR